MSRQYRSFDALEEDSHLTEVCAVHWLDSGPSISGSLDGKIKVWTTSLEGSTAGSLSNASPHMGMRSISSSSRSGKILTSDMLGTVALWDAIEENPGEEDDIEMRDDQEATTNRWQLRMLDSMNVTEKSFNVPGNDGTYSKQKASTCHVTQIHPEEPLFAATGAWAGAAMYACPNGESSSENKLGTPLQYFSDSDQSTRRGLSDKANGAFGRCITFDQGGSKVAVGTDKGLVTLFDVETGSTLTVVRNHQCPSRAVAFTQAGELLVGSDQCSVTLFDLRIPQWASAYDTSPKSSPKLKESYVDTLKGHEFWITDIKTASDDRHIATSSADGQIKVWDIRGRPSRSIVWQIKEERPVWSLCWKPEAGASSFVTGSGQVNGRHSSGNVRWYQVSGTAN